MNLDQLKEQLPEYAKDTKLNLSAILTELGSPGLSQTQIYGIALTSALSIKTQVVTEAILATANLEEAQITAAKAATSLMAMSNIYYRFVHLVSDKALGEMPARLRMNFMANPGVPKVDFELYSLAASILNGCGACMDAHTQHLLKLGLTYEAIQSTARIASVINSLCVINSSTATDFLA